jgi:3-deoxy-D-manno-octulosonic-acid transferase
VVVIGKSFLSVGGQNPCEAILASKPVVFGPHMENFQPLADRLVASGGAISACNQDELARALTMALDPDLARAMTAHATALIQLHDGATQRILTVLG